MSSIKTNPFAHLRFSLEQVTGGKVAKDMTLGVGLHEQAISKSPNMVMMFYFPHITTGMWVVGYTAYIGNLIFRLSSSAGNGLFRSKETARTWALGEILKLYDIEAEKKPKERDDAFRQLLLLKIEEASQYIINF